MLRIEEIVSNVVEKHKLADPYLIAASIGISLLFADLGTLKGYYRQSEKIKIIVINNKLDTKAAQFVCAHELGHVIMHEKINRILLSTSLKES